MPTEQLFTATIPAIASFQVSSSQKAREFISDVFYEIEKEAIQGKSDAANEAIAASLDSTYNNSVIAGQKINSRNLPKPHDPFYPAMFSQLKRLAESMGAPSTAKSIVSAAKWYWDNIEKPATNTSVSIFSPPKSSNPAAGKEWKQWALISGLGLTGLVLIYMGLKNK